MRKWMLTLLIAIFALPFFSSAVLAEDTEGDLEDGTYEDVDYVIKHEVDDEVSKADEYFEKPATITAENGNKYIELKITGSNMVKSVEVPSGSVENISKNEDDNTRVVGFEVEGDLSEPVEMKIHVVVPGFYDEVHTTRAFFEVNTEDEETHEPEEEDTQNSEPGSQNPEEQPNDGDHEVEEQPDENTENNEGNNEESGYYTINFDALHLDRDRPSAMAGYMVDPAFVEKDDGSIELTIAVANETVTKLQLNDQDSVDSRVDGDTRYETFTFDSLPDELDGYVEYQAPYNGSMFESNADFILVLNNESLKEATENDKYAAKYVAPEIPEPEEEPEEDETPQGEEEPVTPDEVDPLTPDSAYEIEFDIRQSDSDEESAAANFIHSPGVLLEKDGELYLQVEVTGRTFFESLETANGDAVLVKENDDGSAIVQFKVDGKISDMIKLDMIINVPGMDAYEGDHSARLFLDENNMTELDASAYELAASANENGPTVEGVNGKVISGEEITSTSNNDNGTSDNDNGTNGTSETDETNDDETETPEKPEFGQGEDNNDDDSAVGGQQSNPKTGDTTNVMLYVLLLIGSAIPLAIQLKRRFV